MFNRRYIKKDTEIVEQIDTGEYLIYLNEKDLFTVGKDGDFAFKSSNIEFATDTITVTFFKKDPPAPVRSRSVSMDDSLVPQYEMTLQFRDFNHENHKLNKTSKYSVKFYDKDMNERILSGVCLFPTNYLVFFSNLNGNKKHGLVCSISKFFNAGSLNQAVWKYSFLSTATTLPKTLEFFKTDLETDNKTSTSYGLLNGVKVNRAAGVDGNNADGNAFRYLLKTPSTLEGVDHFNFLKRFLSETDFVGNPLKDRFGTSSFSFTQKQLGYTTTSAPRIKRLNRAELLSRYYVYKVSLNGNEANSLGMVDFVIFAFNKEGYKISQDKVAVLKDLVGQNVFILIPKVLEDNGFDIINEEKKINFSYLIFQPKTYFVQKTDLKEIKLTTSSYNNNSYEFTLTGMDNDKITDANDFLFLLQETPTSEKFIIDQSRIFFEKNNEYSGIVANNIEQKTTLVSRQNNYHNKLRETEIVDKGVTNSKITLKLFINKIDKCVFSIIPKRRLDDYYVASSSGKDYVSNISKYSDLFTTIGETSYKIYKMYEQCDVFVNKTDDDHNLMYRIDYYANKDKLNQSNFNRIEIIPKFHNRRSIKFQFSNVVPNVSSVFSYNEKLKFDINKYEILTKIVSSYEVDDSHEEYSIYKNASDKMLLFSTESGSNMNDTITEGLKFEIVYSYGDYIEPKVKKKYENLTNVTANFSFIPYGYAKEYYNNSFSTVTDPEQNSFFNVDGSQLFGTDLTSEVFLLDKDQFGTQISDDEPFYRIKNGKIETIGFDYNFSGKLKEVSDGYLLEGIKGLALKSLARTELYDTIQELKTMLSKQLKSDKITPTGSPAGNISANSFTAIELTLNSAVKFDIEYTNSGTKRFLFTCIPGIENKFIFIPYGIDTSDSSKTVDIKIINNQIVSYTKIL